MILAAQSQAELVAALEQASGYGGGGAWRVAVLNPTPDRIATAKRAVEAGKDRFGRDGIYFSPRGVIADGGKIAFLFPGIEAQFDPDLEDVARQFGLEVPEFSANTELGRQGLGVFLVNLLYERVLSDLAVKPDAIAGHSIGEWSGMVAAGVLDRDEVQQYIESTLQAETLEVPDVSYLAAGASAERAMAAVASLSFLSVSHDNCDRQSILCGPDEQINQAADMLRAAGIICEVLPFKSGFHSPAFEAYVDHPVKLLEGLHIRPTNVPLWSATTCEPYPTDSEAVRHLFREHLVRPVRFRELILRLYDDGVRAFVQVGPGRLTSFVDDVLLDRRHTAVSLSAFGVPGMEQLRRASAELFVTGADVRLEALGLPRDMRPHPKVRLSLAAPLVRLETRLGAIGAGAIVESEDSALLNEFSRSMRELLDSQRDIASAFAERQHPMPVREKKTSTPPSKSRLTTLKKRLSLEEYPELLDHCLTRQAEGWPDLVDLRPTAPMTMLLSLMAEAVQELNPGRVAVRIEQVAASTWLHVEPPVVLEVLVEPLGERRFRVSLGEYATGVVILADRYPEAPPPSSEPLVNEGPLSLDIPTTYRDHWLFHGPRYQGLETFGAIADNGIRGRLTSLAARGGLLDNAGQLYGLWIALKGETDRIAMPLRIRSVDFFEPEPQPGDLVDCKVWIRQFGSNLVTADIELTRAGRVCTRIEGWDDWRFETGGRLYPLYRFPEQSLLALPHPHGFVVVEDPGWASSTIEFLTRRYLSAGEVSRGGITEGTPRFTEWLIGRIAAKDAVRKLLFEAGHRSIFPAEVEITSDESGRPIVSTSGARDIRVSIAHKKGIAVAIAAEGVSPGIDVEQIEEHGEGFEALAFHAEELAMLPEQDRAAWATRLWSAKEAVGKSRGTGLSGNPKSLRVDRIEGESLLVEDQWVDTSIISGHIVAWTRQ